MLRVLDLFSGIGGFSLGLEATGGFRTVQFVELDDYCRSVLHRHWPEVPIHDDVRTFSAPVGFADVICGGFPCQDLSLAGKGAGLTGARSGLWGEFARTIRDVRPNFVIVENVAALLHRGLGVILGDLAALGYDAEWHCLPASSVGAPHRRDRVWIVAYTRDGGLWRRPWGTQELQAREPVAVGSSGFLADADGEGEPQQARRDEEGGRWAGDSSGDAADAASRGHGCDGSRAPGEGQPAYSVPALADADGEGAGIWPGRGVELEESGAGPWHVAHPEGIPLWSRLREGVEARLGYGRSGDGGGPRELSIAGRPRLALGQRALREWSYAAATGEGWWATEPDVGRVAYDVPARVQRLKALGNAVVPLIPFILGTFILDAVGGKD